MILTVIMFDNIVAEPHSSTPRPKSCLRHARAAAQRHDDVLACDRVFGLADDATGREMSDPEIEASRTSLSTYDAIPAIINERPQQDKNRIA